MIGLLSVYELLYELWQVSKARSGRAELRAELRALVVPVLALLF